VDRLAGAQPLLDQVPQLPGHQGARIALLERASFGHDICGSIWPLDAGVPWGGPPFLNVSGLLLVEGIFRWASLVLLWKDVEGV
jgi:hypothetical protein